MSTTIDRLPLRRFHLASACALAMGLWFGGLAVVARAFEPTQAVIVFAAGTAAAVASVKAADVDLLDAGASFVTVAGRSPGFVRDLYAGGAWLVLPAGGGGCRTPVERRARAT